MLELRNMDLSECVLTFCFFQTRETSLSAGINFHLFNYSFNMNCELHRNFKECILVDFHTSFFCIGLADQASSESPMIIGSLFSISCYPRENNPLTTFWSIFIHPTNWGYAYLFWSIFWVYVWRIGIKIYFSLSLTL